MISITIGRDSGPPCTVGELLPCQALRQTSGDNLLGYLVSSHAIIIGRSLALRLPRRRTYGAASRRESARRRDDPVGALLVVPESRGALHYDGVDAVAFVAREFVGDAGPGRIRADLDRDVGIGAKVEHPPGISSRPAAEPTT